MVSSIQLKGVGNLATNKNITMKQFNGTDYDTLYPKTIASQIPDVYSKTDIITTETLSQLGLSADKLPNDAFQQIKTLIDNVQTSADGKAKIQTGSYVGTGTHGSDNPCSLTFDFEPQIVIITAPHFTTNTTAQFIASYGGTVTCIPQTYKNPNGSNYTSTKTVIQYNLIGNNLTWYYLDCYTAFSYAEASFNYLNKTYYFIAIA